MEHGEHDFESRTVLFLMHTCRDTTSVIPDSDGIILVDIYLNIRTVSGKSLIDTVINHLINKMMETSFTDVTDIHRRSLPHGLKAFKHLNTVRGILFRRSIADFVLVHYPLSESNQFP